MDRITVRSSLISNRHFHNALASAAMEPGHFLFWRHTCLITTLYYRGVYIWNSGSEAFCLCAAYLHTRTGRLLQLLTQNANIQIPVHCPHFVLQRKNLQMKHLSLIYSRFSYSSVKDLYKTNVSLCIWFASMHFYVALG